VNWDATLFYAINGWAEQSAWMDWAMLALGRTSSLLIPGALAFGYWLWRKRQEALVGATVLAGLILLTDFIGAQVKHLAGRIRPCHMLTGVHQLTGCGGTFSFPSNHALNTAAAAAFAQVLYPATGWVTWPLVAVIGFSRVYVGAHYAGDVLGGWVIGGLLGAGAAFWLIQWPVFRPKLTSRQVDKRPS
jgi:undecaprenyl-diphosphatase